MIRTNPALTLSFALAVALATASCTTTAPDLARPADAPLRIEGTITAIDLQPWAYDGNATVQVDADGRGNELGATRYVAGSSGGRRPS